MSKKSYYIIGDPVEHSLSPRLYSAILASHAKHDYTYERKKITLETLHAQFACLKREKFAGLSVTMPLKQAIMPLLDHIDEDAAAIGAVNTVKNKDGKLVGYNSDWQGVADPLVNLSIKSAVVFGAGGAARAAIYALQRIGVPQIYCSNRSIEKSEALAEEFGIEYGTPEKTDLIYNATSVGMGELKGQSPVPEHLITKDTIVFDAIYEPQETRLIRDAKQVGCKCITGVDMFAAQAKAQIKILLGIDVGLEEIKEAIQ